MMKIDENLTPEMLTAKLERFWKVSAEKICSLEKNHDLGQSSPVFTVQGKYTSRGWTEWTQGFQYGSAILQFDATGDDAFLEIGRNNTVNKMASHVSHTGVHDHGFNNLSTYGNLLRLIREDKIHASNWEHDFYALAIKVSACVQAARWTDIADGGGFIYSFNGPHSLFVDTIRSCRILMLAHKLGHVFQGEGDKVISLLGRACKHMEATAKYAVYYNEERDSYDQWGRVAHESVFNVNDGNYRCPNTQQGYSGFTTWTRGLAWAMVGFAEELELLETIADEELLPFGGREKLTGIMEKAARATCDFFIANTPTDGITYWDSGAPDLWKLGDYLNKPSDPYNEFEPIDSSASAIGAQGLMRLGHYLKNERYFKAGLTVLRTLLDEPYLSIDSGHQGLLLHSIYHRPNGWDYIPEGSKIPRGESCMWGDYHLREAALYVHKRIKGEPYYTFFHGS